MIVMLAFLHHLAAFTLVFTFDIEFVLLRRAAGSNVCVPPKRDIFAL